MISGSEASVAVESLQHAIALWLCGGLLRMDFRTTVLIPQSERHDDRKVIYYKTTYAMLLSRCSPQVSPIILPS